MVNQTLLIHCCGSLITSTALHKKSESDFLARNLHMASFRRKNYTLPNVAVCLLKITLSFAKETVVMLLNGFFMSC